MRAACSHADGPDRCTQVERNHTLVPRRHRSHRRSVSLLRTHAKKIAAAVMLLIAPVLAVTILTRSADTPPPAVNTGFLATPDFDDATFELTGLTDAVSPSRPVYNYSVVPGGTYNAVEVGQAMARD